MTQEGASFRSRRATEGKDFLASSDTWFHPVYAATGPDGSLYIADFYRKFIDHPEYLPKEVREKLDFDSGKDRGRIWRVFAAKTKAATLTNASPAVLVAAVMSSNIWKRETAHRLILERPDNAVVAEITRIFEPFQEEAKSGDAENAINKWAEERLPNDPVTGEHLGRARAVSLLHDLILHHRKSFRLDVNRAGNAMLLATFDPSPSVREAAFRAFQVMSDRRNPIPDVGGETLEMWVSDPNPAVRFHLAYSLGQGDYRRMTEALVKILRRDAADRWTRAVVLSGLKERMPEFTEKWFATEFDDSEPSVALAFEMGRVYGTDDANGREVLMRHAFSASADGTGWQSALLSGLLEAGNKQVKEWVRNPGNDRALEIQKLCMTRALDTTLALYKRSAAVRLLGEFSANGSEALLQIVTGSHPKELQIVAARSLVKISDLALPEPVFNQWREMSPELREVFVGYLVSKPERSVLLLDAVERGLVPAWNINANRRQVLLRHRNEAVKERAERLLGAQGGGDRSKVFEDYKPVLLLKGDAQSGQKIFLNVCASCHQHGKEGYAVGPDLSGLKNQPAEAVLYHILMPDAEIYAGYENYEVETKTGEHFNGLLVEENKSNITLVRALGEKLSIPRAGIARLRTSASSLMPAELEKAMTRQELADLLAFLRSR